LLKVSQKNLLHLVLYDWLAPAEEALILCHQER